MADTIDTERKTHDHSAHDAHVAERVSEIQDSVTALGAAILQLKNNEPENDEYESIVAELEERFHDLRRDFEALEAAEQARHEATDEERPTRGENARETMGRIRSNAEERWQSARDRVDAAYRDLRNVVSTGRTANALKDANNSFSRAWKDVSDRFEKSFHKRPPQETKENVKQRKNNTD